MNYHEDNAVDQFFGKNARTMSRSINALISHGYLKITQQDESFATYSICIPRAVAEDIITDKSQSAVDQPTLKITKANDNIYVNAEFLQASVPCSLGNPVTASRIFLGNRYPGVYLSRRESECVFMLMLGKSRKDISVRLSISTKTIDFYIQSIKVKLVCQSSREIISCIQQTDFVKNVQNSFD